MKVEKKIRKKNLEVSQEHFLSVPLRIACPLGVASVPPPCDSKNLFWSLRGDWRERYLDRARRSFRGRKCNRSKKERETDGGRTKWQRKPTATAWRGGESVGPRADGRSGKSPRGLDASRPRRPRQERGPRREGRDCSRRRI